MLRRALIKPWLPNGSVAKSIICGPQIPVPAAPGVRYYQSLGTGGNINAQGSPKSRSRLRKILNIGLFGFAFASLGFCVALSPALLNLSVVVGSANKKPQAFVPENEEAAVVDATINNHPLAAALRSRPEMTESRPHMKFPEVFRKQNLTGGTLLGPGRLTVPPIIKVAVTARLEVNYRKPTPAGTFVVLRAETQRVEGRKAWVAGRIETLVDETKGEKPVVLVEANGLFISPKAGFSALLSKFT
ncbi:hypothetical protein HYQ46_011629 [Verticillium longisporum]|nr:hypothetical protein HYQ46_011629 [Verticillium longisporum]